MNDELLAKLCDHVVAGGGAIDFCASKKITYAALMSWLSADAARRKQYDFALSARNEWAIQNVIDQLRKISDLDIRRAYGPHGDLLAIHDMPPDIAGAISNVESVQYVDDSGFRSEIKKIRFWDKNRALESLARTLAMFGKELSSQSVGGQTVMPEITLDNKPIRFNIGSHN